MQQIINFLIRYKNFLLFAFLLLLSLIFTIQSHSYHRSKFVNSANFFSGGIYSSVSGIQDYFNLKEYNQQLLEENARIRETVVVNDVVIQTPVSLGILAPRVLLPDSIAQYHYIPAKVINNSYSKMDNFITLKAGSRDSLKPDMGVMTSKGIVGVVDKISERYSTVISILNTNFETNAKLKVSYHSGTLRWDGKNPNVMQLVDMQRQAPVAVGDTIETSGKSAIFPKGITIGTVKSFSLDESKNFYTINVQLIHDMTSLGHVYVIENRHLEEIKTIEAASEE